LTYEKSLSYKISKSKSNISDCFTIEDLVQEALIKWLQSAHKLDEKSYIKNRLSRISTNLLIDKIRKQSKFKKVDNDEFDILDIISTSEQKHDLDVNQISPILRKAINELPTEQKEVVLLRHYWDMSFKEISFLTKTSINTCLWRMRYALINLRKNELVSEEFYKSAMNDIFS